MYIYIYNSEGSVVVKALRYWSGGPGINSRWCHWGSFPWHPPPPRRNHMPWGRLSLWKWVPGISLGVKAAGAYGWRPTTLVVPNVKKIRGLNLPGTPWVTSVCCGMTFTFTTYRVSQEECTRFGRVFLMLKYTDITQTPMCKFERLWR